MSAIPASVATATTTIGTLPDSLANIHIVAESTGKRVISSSPSSHLDILYFCKLFTEMAEINRKNIFILQTPGKTLCSLEVAVFSADKISYPPMIFIARTSVMIEDMVSLKNLIKRPFFISADTVLELRAEETLARRIKRAREADLLTLNLAEHNAFRDVDPSTFSEEENYSILEYLAETHYTPTLVDTKTKAKGSGLDIAVINEDLNYLDSQYCFETLSSQRNLSFAYGKQNSSTSYSKFYIYTKTGSFLESEHKEDEVLEIAKKEVFLDNNIFFKLDAMLSNTRRVLQMQVDHVFEEDFLPLNRLSKIFRKAINENHTLSHCQIFTSEKNQTKSTISKLLG
ncbi:MAG: hypothetical protein FJZ56_06045 [Chlamydiae bacterium]|nr:hypothetical protein [Chlamydiota bacterium]